MAGIELLKQGIELRDWNQIIRFYNEMTGSNMPFFDLEHKEDLKTTLNETRQETKQKDSYIVQIRDNSKKKPKIIIDPDTGEAKTIAQFIPIDVEKIKTVGNLWNPDDYICSIPKNEEEEHKKTKYKEKPKNRQKPQKIEYKSVVCSACKKEFIIHPFFDKENYICDECIKRKMRK